jgi:hypothetical protein
MRLLRGSALGLVALVAALPLAGCQTPDNTATLTYDQTANFLEYSIDGTGSGHHAAQNRSFVLYRIVSVDNTGSKAQPFTLDPTRAKTGNSQGISTDHIGSEKQVLGGELLAKIDIAPGTKLTATPGHQIGCVAMEVTDTSPQTLVHGQETNLFWTSGNPDVKLNTVRANTTIATISGPASPTLLQHRCQNKFN